MTTTPAQPTVTVYNDDDPTPRVEVVLTPGADAVTTTIFRYSSLGRAPVRGAFRQPNTGTMLVVDYEVPFGEPVTYAGIGYASDGTASAEGPASEPVTLNLLGVPRGCPWFHDPSNPSSARRFQVLSWPSRAHTREASVHYPMLSRVGVAIVGPLRDATSVMTVLTRDQQSASDLAALLRAGTIMVRPSPEWGWRGGYFLVGGVSEVTETRFNPTVGVDPLRTWEIALTPVVATDARLAGTLYTYAHILEYYATYADLAAAKPTYLDILRNPAPGPAATGKTSA